MKITQYCSVCKTKLAMEVVPTDDGEEDGVLWLRCPQCQGFLPKISGALAGADDDADAGAGDDPTSTARPADGDSAAGAGGSPVEGESPVGWPTRPTADRAPLPDEVLDDDPDGMPDDDRDDDDEDVAPDSSAAAPEPQATPAEDWSAELAAMDVTLAKPYRPWEAYALGDVIHHLAWDDCGVVVGQEVLPGQRKVIKVAFEKSGVHRLIVESSRS